MLFVCNYQDVLHSDVYYSISGQDINLDDILNIVDTDDFVMQSVRAKDIIKYIKRGSLQIANIAYDAGTDNIFIREQVADFHEALCSSCISNDFVSFKLNDDGETEIIFKDGKRYNLSLYTTISSDYLYLIGEDEPSEFITECRLNDNPLVEFSFFKTSSCLQWQVSYAFMFKDYFVLKTLLYNEGLSVPIKLVFRGSELVYVSDDGYNTDYISEINFENKDKNFEHLYQTYLSKAIVLNKQYRY